MKYIVIEMQTGAGGVVGNIVTTFDDKLTAESQYHSVLASAAVSQLPEHAAVLMNSQGQVYETRCYEHLQAEPELEE